MTKTKKFFVGEYGHFPAFRLTISDTFKEIIFECLNYEKGKPLKKQFANDLCEVRDFRYDTPYEDLSEFFNHYTSFYYSDMMINFIQEFQKERIKVIPLKKN